MNTHTQQDLLLFKAKLMEMKEKEEAQLEGVYKQIKELGDNGNEEKGVDTTAYSVQFEDLLNAKSRLTKHLSQVNNGLLRLQNNHYGICSETGLLISRDRLLAVPTTTLSMEGKSIRDKNAIK